MFLFCLGELERAVETLACGWCSHCCLAPSRPRDSSINYNYLLLIRGFSPLHRSLRSRSSLALCLRSRHFAHSQPLKKACEKPVKEAVPTAFLVLPNLHMSFYLSNNALFRVTQPHLNTRRVGRTRDNYANVMQTRHEVEGLHNFREFSQPPSVQMRLCKHPNVLYCFYKITFQSTRESKTSQPCLYTLRAVFN